MENPDPQADPFEEFRRKKNGEEEKRAAAGRTAHPRPPREDGRPAGFSSHRYDFDKKADETRTETPDRPKGFQSTQLPPDPAPSSDAPPKPKGFQTHKLT